MEDDFSIKSVPVKKIRVGKSAVLNSRDIYQCKRVFNRSTLRIENLGADNAVVMIRWIGDDRTSMDDVRLKMTIAPGSYFELGSSSTSFGQDFLEMVEFRHVRGSSVLVQCLVPLGEMN